jgi:hypothetical protein
MTRTAKIARRLAIGAFVLFVAVIALVVTSTDKLETDTTQGNPKARQVCAYMRAGDSTDMVIAYVSPAFNADRAESIEIINQVSEWCK